MKPGFAMHLPKEDGNAGDFFDLDIEALFGNASNEKTDGYSRKDKLELCPECLLRGENSVLAPFQLNFEEAIYMCPVQSCTYPMKEDNLVSTFVVKRDASTLPLLSSPVKPPKRKSRKSSGYSTFFEEFNPDVEFPDFTFLADNQPTPSLHVAALSEPVDDDSTHLIGITNQAKIISKDKQVPLPSIDQNVAVSSEVGHTATDPMMVSQTTVKAEGENEPNMVNMEGAVSGINIVMPSVVDTGDVVSNPMEPPLGDYDEDSVMDVEPMSKSSGSNGMNESMDCATEGNGLASEVDFSDDFDIPRTSLEESLKRPPAFEKMLQWTNKHNSCWLDAIMQVLVSSVNARGVLNESKAGSESHLKRLFVAYDECQRTLQEQLSDQKSLIEKLDQRMSKIRGHVLSTLNKTSPIKLGEFQSLLEMFPLVLRSDPLVQNLFNVHLLYDFQCEHCGHRRARRSLTNVVSIPHTLPDFHPLNSKFTRCCYECKSSRGVTTIHMERLPPCLMFHFQAGLPHSNLQVLDFAVQGHLYSVFAVVQYVLSPFKHFITWIRDKKTNKWRCCDDLEDAVCSWQTKKPNLEPNQIHLVFWELQLSCEPDGIRLGSITPVINEEVSSLSDEIPLELFFAHEDDETIIIPEDEHLQKIPEDRKSPNVGQVSNECSVRTWGLHHSHSVPAMTKASMHTGSQDLSYCSDETAGHQGLTIPPQMPNNSFQFSPAMFQNGGMTIVPNGNGQQMIQLVAPANTCSIFIMTNDSKQQPVYIGSQKTSNPANSSPTTPCSFLDNPHCDNIVSQGIHGSATSSGKNHFMAHRPKRQYRLAGYSKQNPSKKFSPMKATRKPNSVSRSARSSVDTRSEYSYNSKKDSDTLSEASELSDRLPDFEFETNGSRRSSVATSSTSLQTSHSTTPTNGENLA